MILSGLFASYILILYMLNQIHSATNLTENIYNSKLFYSFFLHRNLYSFPIKASCRSIYTHATI